MTAFLQWSRSGALVRGGPGPRDAYFGAGACFSIGFDGGEVQEFFRVAFLYCM